jgi:hypothetical protein
MASVTAQMNLGEVGENLQGNMLEKRKSAPENTLTAIIEP